MTKSSMTLEQKRIQAINSAIASVRAEGLEPSAATQQRLKQYAQGKITAEQLQHDTLAEAKAIPILSATK